MALIKVFLIKSGDVNQVNHDDLHIALPTKIVHFVITNHGADIELKL